MEEAADSSGAIRASAPGKLMLCGEYAVLEGGPAILMAVSRRARVRIETARGALETAQSAPRETAQSAPGETATKKKAAGSANVRVAGLAVRPLPYKYCPDSRLLQFPDATEEEQQRLSLFKSVLETLTATLLGTPSAWEASECLLDSSALFAGERKLGLGSSAALCVALGAAWHKYLGLPAPGLHDLQEAHFRFQGHSGSGADVAASLLGGFLTYRQTAPGKGQAETVHAPDELRTLFLWTGEAADTREMLSYARTFKSQRPTSYSAIMSDLRQAAEACAQALPVASASACLSALSDFTEVLREFASCSGVPVFSGPHERLSEIARRAALLYKPLGAGGGDWGMAACEDPQKLRVFAQQAETLGVRAMDLQIEQAGLHWD